MDLCLERLDRRDPEFGIDFSHMHLYDLTAFVEDFTIDGQAIYTSIERLAARERAALRWSAFRDVSTCRRAASASRMPRS